MFPHCLGVAHAKDFVTLFIDLLDGMQDSVVWQRAAANILAHVRWPCHLPGGSVQIRIEACAPEAFMDFLLLRRMVHAHTVPWMQQDRWCREIC